MSQNVNYGYQIQKSESKVCQKVMHKMSQTVNIAV